MSIRITCPSCDDSFSVADDMRGKRILCRSCGKAVLVGAVKPEQKKDDSVAERKASPPASTGRGSASRRQHEDEKDDDEQKRPLRKSSRRRDEDDEEERPARTSSRRHQDEDDEDNRPRRKKQKQKAGSSMPLILLASFGGVLLLLCIFGGVVYVLSTGNEKKVANVIPAPVFDAAGQRIRPQPFQAQAPFVVLPAGPAPQQIDRTIVQKVKSATAYLHIVMPGAEAEGSGFLGIEPGIVITNAHVIGMLQADSPPPQRIDVVFNSGTPGAELKLAGAVAGVDRDNDLAVLRLVGDTSRLPPPLQVDSAANLVETQKLYVFGFPFGAKLGKDMTVSDTTVTSLRKDAGGALRQVQVNGGMNPGNSGGPVVDARGVVVGVSVSIIQGTQINFAIPGDRVREVLLGRVQEFDVGFPFLDQGQRKVPVKVACLDPMNRVRQVKVDVWTGNPNVVRPLVAPPPLMAGDSPRHSVPANYQPGQGSVDVPLPPLEAGKAYWFQATSINSTGGQYWCQAIAVQPRTDAALERRPANLKFNAPALATERTLDLRSHVSFTLTKGDKALVLADRAEGQLLESLQPDARGLGTSIRLSPGQLKFSGESGGRTIPRHPLAVDAVQRYSPTFLVDAANALKERGNRDFKMLPPSYGGEAEDLFERLCNAYEATTLALPNRQVQPLESWGTRSPMLLKVNNNREIIDMLLTCTYDGLLNEGGRKQAHISLTGRLQARNKNVPLMGGKIRGHALFDLEKGYLSTAQLAVTSDLGGGDVRLQLVNDMSVSRVEGNAHKIAVATQDQPAPNQLAQSRVLLGPINQQLTTTDPHGEKSKPGANVPYKLIAQRLEGGKTYVIEMTKPTGTGLDPYLRLETKQGTVLAEDDDGAGEQNSRIVFTPTSTDDYNIYATTLEANQYGPFSFSIAEIVRAPTPAKEKSGKSK
jgi:S1-C subfamily serine protease